MCVLIGDVNCDITVIGYGMDAKRGPRFSCLTPAFRWVPTPFPSVTDEPCPVLDPKRGPGFSCITPAFRWVPTPFPSVTDEPCPVLTLRMLCPYIFLACCPGPVTAWPFS